MISTGHGIPVCENERILHGVHYRKVKRGVECPVPGKNLKLWGRATAH